MSYAPGTLVIDTWGRTWKVLGEADVDPRKGRVLLLRDVLNREEDYLSVFWVKKIHGLEALGRQAADAAGS